MADARWLTTSPPLVAAGGAAAELLSSPGAQWQPQWQPLGGELTVGSPGPLEGFFGSPLAAAGWAAAGELGGEAGAEWQLLGGEAAAGGAGLLQDPLSLDDPLEVAPLGPGAPPSPHAHQPPPQQQTPWQQATAAPAGAPAPALRYGEPAATALQQAAAPAAAAPSLEALPSTILGLLGVPPGPSAAPAFAPSIRRLPPLVTPPSGDPLLLHAGSEALPPASLLLGIPADPPAAAASLHGASAAEQAAMKLEGDQHHGSMAGSSATHAQRQPQSRPARRPRSGARAAAGASREQVPQQQQQPGMVEEDEDEEEGQSRPKRSAHLEAQRRYLQRKKERMLDMERQLDLLAAELAAARLANERAQEQADAYQLMLGYKEDMMAALELGGQTEGRGGVKRLTPETLVYLEQYNAGGLLKPEVVLRYAVAGSTANMDAEGLPRQEPPFELVVQDYAGAVQLYREVLQAAEASGRAMAAEASSAGAPLVVLDPPPAEPLLQYLSHPERPIWRHMVSGAGGGDEGSSGSSGSDPPGSTGGAGGADWDTSGSLGSGLAAPGSPAARDASPGSDNAAESAAAAAESGVQQGGQRPKKQPQRAAGVQQSALGAAPGAEGAPACPLHATSPPGSPNDSHWEQPAGSGGEGCSSSCSAGSDSEAEREELEQGLQRFLAEATLVTAGRHMGYRGGLLVQSGADLYYFTPQQLRTCAELIVRVGCLMWQQAVLWPNNLMRVLGSKLDTGQLRAAQDVPLSHWERVYARLALRPDQLDLLGMLHGEYLQTVRSTGERQREATARLQQLQAQLDYCSTGAAGGVLAAEVSQLNLAIRDCAAELERCVHEENAAEVKLFVGAYLTLDFPLQMSQIFAISWPHFPQVAALATIAAARPRCLPDQGQQ